MERFEKVATPATAETVALPESVPLPGLAPIATVTLAVEVVTVLPKVSWMAVFTAGEMEAPAVALVGCTMKATCAAVAALMVKALEVAPVSDPEAAVRV